MVFESGLIYGFNYKKGGYKVNLDLHMSLLLWSLFSWYTRKNKSGIEIFLCENNWVYTSLTWGSDFALSVELF